MLCVYIYIYIYYKYVCVYIYIYMCVCQVVQRAPGDVEAYESIAEAVRLGARQG